MKIVITHASPDWDAITSVWLIKRFLPNWENAKVMFVPAGERIRKGEGLTVKRKGDDKTLNPKPLTLHPIERIGEDEVIHVDTGMGPLDHHQTDNLQESAASRTWEYIYKEHSGGEKWFQRANAIERIVNIIVEIDHFQEVYWENPIADHYEFSLLGLLEGLKYQKPGEDEFYLLFGMECLDALVHEFENRAWAEKEIAEKGIVFKTRFGRAIGIETINDTVLKLAQKMGYKIVIRKDPRSGFVRIKALPERAFREETKGTKETKEPKGIDFTLITEKLSKMDPEATWYLHVSKKMLLNGTTKNPNMVPTKLSLKEIIEVVKGI